VSPDVSKARLVPLSLFLSHTVDDLKQAYPSERIFTTRRRPILHRRPPPRRTDRKLNTAPTRTPPLAILEYERRTGLLNMLVLATNAGPINDHMYNSTRRTAGPPPTRDIPSST